MSAALSTVHLGHRYGDHMALSDVTFDVQPGALHALLGPNGSGKTTLFRILATLLRPSEGTASVDGHDVVDAPDAVRRRIGVVFQHVALDPALTVQENLDVQAALYGLARPDARARSADLLDALSLNALAHRRVKTLSGGETRRADLARALLHRPDLLLLDEPTTALDPTARQQFQTLLTRLRAQEGMTILVSTHLLDEAEHADGVTILHAGSVVAHGAPQTLTAALGNETLWIVPASGSALDGTPPSLPGGRIERIGDRLRVTHPRPADALADLTQRYPASVASATLRTPTLEDVFFHATGTDYQP